MYAFIICFEVIFCLTLLFLSAAELLIKARETAEKTAANQALFLANMSHEVLQK